MRDVNRLDEFYDKLKQVHAKSFPDWRFGQLICNFIYFYGDPFYLEEDIFLNKIKEFADKYST